MWFAFGDYDVVAITEMPDNVSAAALAIAFAGGSACKIVHTTPLMSQEEALQAMRKAGESGYRSPMVTPRAAQTQTPANGRLLSRSPIFLFASCSCCIEVVKRQLQFRS